MSLATAPPDLGLSIPLHGVQLIEASAGTGKTFTLATLVARLVIEQRLPVTRILAVTYTVAASEELRERLRQRLALAARLAAGEVDALAAAAAHEDARLTRALVEAAVAREGVDALRQRLRAQAQAMDLAPVFTIHGFCARALADHALEAARPALGATLLANPRALREEAATDLWRTLSLDHADAAALRERWGDPAGLAKTLPQLLAADELHPPAVAVDAGDEAVLVAERAAAAAEVCARFAASGEDAWRALDVAMDGGVMNGSRFRRDSVTAAWQALAEWVAAGARGAPANERVAWLATPELVDRTVRKHAGKTPASPLFDALARWFAADAALAAHRQARAVALAHRVRGLARERLDALKRQRGVHDYDDLIAGVADALDGADGARFARRLQDQYRVALVDEFQDTDARQWAIFRRLFATPAEGEDGAARALFLIGDPKQAIYRFRGGDVNTYLAAAESARQRHALARNFRSRARVLAAIEALFERAGEHAFAEPRIRFQPVEAAAALSDEALRRDGRAVAGLHVLTLSPPVDGGELSVEAARTQATAACVNAIATLLGEAAAGRARLVEAKGAERAVRAGDIAVLVERHDDGERIQRALAAAGIAAVAAGRRSLFATDEAEDVRRLLAGLLAPGDEARLRAALATPLFGFDAAGLHALDADAALHRQTIDRLQGLRERWDRHGPLALLTALCAAEAPRLLRLIDGERRLTNYLQLAEMLQAEQARALGGAGLFDALERRIGEADDHDDAQQLRLESDAARVKILTLHKSKGLQFPLVFLPFAATGGRGGNGQATAAFNQGTRRLLVLRDDPQYRAAQQREADETLAEKLRLLYVGLTRAEHAAWVAWGPVNGASNTALGWLLHQRDGCAAGALDGQAVARALAQWQAAAPAAVELQPAATATPGRLVETDPGEVPAPRAARRQLGRDWWVHSFSQLARADAGATEAESGAQDEIVIAAPGSPFAGARFGNVLHHALEHADFAAWRGGSEDAPPQAERAILVGALRDAGYTREEETREGVALLARLMRHTLNVALPEGLRLCELPRAQRRDEMEFHLALAATRVEAVLALLHAHGVVRARRAFGLRERLEGLLTGKIDLVYAHAGRYFLLDYKSNQLPGFDAASLAAAMAESEYDLQYVLYALALHRWLRFRLGEAYDYDSHFGGVRYLFCRGLDATRVDSPGADAPGVFATRPPRALIEGLDALFAGAGVAA